MDTFILFIQSNEFVNTYFHHPINEFGYTQYAEPQKQVCNTAQCHCNANK